MRRDRLLQVVVAAGAVLRLANYVRRPALSFDETMLSVNIGTRSFTGLLHTLDYDQVAPPLFLWLTRAVTRVGGMNEWTLRVLPLVAGLVLPLAVWRLARKLLPEGAALFAALIVALAPGLVQYAGIVKPYAIDALVTTVLLDLALEVRTRNDQRSWAWLIGIGALAIPLSAAALLILASIGICLTFSHWRTRWGALAVAAVLWLGFFALIYTTVYRDTAASVFMQRFWVHDFLIPRSFGIHGRAWGILKNSFIEALLLRPTPDLLAFFFCLVVLVGLVWITRQKGFFALWLLVGPVLFTGVASSVYRYPFSWRLLQFAVPLVALWLAAAGAAMTTVLGTMGARAGVAAVALVLVVVNVSHPYRTSPTRTLIDDWANRAGPTEPIYVFQGAVPAWAFYTSDWSHPDSAWLEALAQVHLNRDADLDLARAGRREIIGHYTGIQWYTVEGATQAHPDSTWPGHETRRIKASGSGNIWLLFTQTYKDEVPQLLRALADSGVTRVYADSARGASLYEYRIGGASR
ncbi:MAG TPA: glycosyltransferase family 39 protein [Gemmatimonadales bacterium]|jgi:4-amino-4-deoxy-L-arabinose transferase-like glycosyltransferase|nr:glycosyltransferase family 39 protein [Gemmatimonadales bacterium]